MDFYKDNSISLALAFIILFFKDMSVYLILRQYNQFLRAINFLAKEAFITMPCTIHNVWVPGFGANSGADSVYAVLDGKAIASAAAISPFNPDRVLVWESQTKTVLLAAIIVSTPGTHTFNLWVREDSFFADKIVLTTDPTFVPGGSGPIESPK